MAKKARVWTGTQFVELASAQTDLTAYSTTAQMNTAITNAGAIVPIIPTSVAVGTGTGSYNATTGNITFTSAGSISVNGVFSSTYDKYIIIYMSSASGADNPNLRLRVSGTDSAALSYNATFGRTTSAATFAQITSSQSTSIVIDIVSHANSSASYKNIAKIEIVNPFQTLITNGIVDYTISNTAAPFIERRFGAFSFNATTSFDGFSIISSKNLTGTLKVMAYV